MLLNYQWRYELSREKEKKWLFEMISTRTLENKRRTDSLLTRHEIQSDKPLGSDCVNQ